MLVNIALLNMMSVTATRVGMPQKCRRISQCLESGRCVTDFMGVARILRGCVHPGVDAGFLVWGDDGGAEGPEQGA